MTAAAALFVALFASTHCGQVAETLSIRAPCRNFPQRRYSPFFPVFDHDTTDDKDVYKALPAELYEDIIPYVDADPDLLSLALTYKHL